MIQGKICVLQESLNLLRGVTEVLETLLVSLSHVCLPSHNVSNYSNNEALEHEITHLIERSLEALPGEQVLLVLREPRKPAARDLGIDLRALTHGVRAEIIEERDAHAREERRDRNVRRRELSDREAGLGGEERLQVLERGVEVLDGRVAELHPGPGGDELARNALDEEAGLGALHGIRGEDTRRGEEVGDELDDDQ